MVCSLSLSHRRTDATVISPPSDPPSLGRTSWACSLFCCSASISEIRSCSSWNDCLLINTCLNTGLVGVRKSWTYHQLLEDVPLQLLVAFTTTTQLLTTVNVLVNVLVKLHMSWVTGAGKECLQLWQCTSIDAFHTMFVCIVSHPDLQHKAGSNTFADQI